jgi:thioredoxin-related protein
MKNMSRLLVLTVLGLCVSFSVVGQKGAPDVPAFTLWQTNGRTINKSVLPQGKPVVLVYFAPDCGHCTTLINGVFQEMKAFQNTTLVLATFKPINELQRFEQAYKTATYPNIITGTEGSTFFLRNHYKMQKTPFVALYNKSGKLVRSYNNEPVVKDLLNGLKLL